MNDVFPRGWTDIAGDARFADPGQCSHRADRLGRTVKRRNAVEYAAAALVTAVFGASAFAAAMDGDWLSAACLAINLPAVAFVVWYLHAKGGQAPMRPEEPCAVYLVRALERQRELLSRAWLWYIGPFIPGAVGLYGLVAWRVAAKAGWAVALQGLIVPAAITFGIFGGIAALNLWAARRIKFEIGKLQDGFAEYEENP